MASLSAIISSIFFNVIEGGFIKKRFRVRPVTIYGNKNKENDTIVKKSNVIRLTNRRTRNRARIRRAFFIR